jgi:excisionase family DNA binding protein
MTMDGDNDQGRPGYFMTIKEVADRWKMSVATIYALIKKGKLPHPVKKGRCARWPEREVIRIANEMEDTRND